MNLQREYYDPSPSICISEHKGYMELPHMESNAYQSKEQYQCHIYQIAGIKH